MIKVEPSYDVCLQRASASIPEGKIYSLHCVATTTKISELDDIFERFKRVLQNIQNIPLIGLEMVANGFGTTAISPSTLPPITNYYYKDVKNVFILM